MKRNDKLFIAIWIVFSVVAVLLMTIFAQPAAAFELEPGEAIDIYCVECEAEGITYINESIGWLCNGEECEECHNCTNQTCQVNKTLEGGESLVMDEGACDLDIFCDTDCYVEEYEYENHITIDKGNDTFTITLDIYGRDGELLKQFKTNIEEEATIHKEDVYPFICEHETITKVGLSQCVKYFEKDLFAGDAVLWPMYQFSQAQINCSNQLIELTADVHTAKDKLISTENERDHFKEEFEDCEAELKKCQSELTAPNGTCSYQKNKIWQDGKNETGFYMWTSGILAFFLAIAGFFHIYSGDE
jgi:hypothetical protein